MSRGPDDIIREYLQREGASRDHAQWTAEEVIEVLEAEEYLIVHRDMVRTSGEAFAAFVAKKTEPAAGLGG